MKKILIIAAIWLFVAGMAMAGEKEDLTMKQELLMWKSRAIQCETPAVLKDMQAEFAANEAKLKELEAKVKKADTGKK